MSSVLFISPHLDDAVFSCAAMMQRLVSEGTRVFVATVFTEGSQGYAQRREEDLAALHLLGVEALHLGHLDAPDRQPPYRTFREIIFGWHEADAATLTAIIRSLHIWLGKNSPTAIYAPLGVGTHVDHRLVHQAVRQLEKNIPVFFYEERPYADAAGAAELRLRELGFEGGPILPSALLKGFRQLPHVKHYLPPGPERKLCEKLLLQPLSQPTSGPATSHLLQAADREARLSQRAAACYASQFQAFCGTTARLQKTDLQYSIRLGSTALRTERYWQLPSSIPPPQPHESPSPH